MEFCNTCKKRNSGIMGYCCFCHNGEEYEEEIKEDTNMSELMVGEIKEENLDNFMKNLACVTTYHATPSRDLVQKLADDLMQVEAEVKKDSGAK